MFPQVQDFTSETVANTATVQMGKSFLFDFKTGDFVINDGRLVIPDNVTAIRVWIEKALRTEQGRFKVYEGMPYGSAISDLIIGTNYSIAFVESELKREIEAALLQHPQISGISNLVLTRETSGITAEFTVVLKDGTTIENEVSFNG